MIGIIGGGVSGLSCGILLAQAGYPVTIWTRDPLPETTSSVAAAIWHPFQVGDDPRVLPWAAHTHRVLYELANDPTTGVVPQTGRELFKERAHDPPWRAIVQRFRHLEPHELPPGYGDGFTFETLVMQTPVYLRYLVQRFQAVGGVMVERTVGSLDEVLDEVDLVVNCSGLAARELADDPSMFPIRGQIMRLAPLPDATFMLDDVGPHPPAYIVPRADGIICGGTIDHGNWSTEVDPATAARIRQGVDTLMPALASQPILEQRVGLRPGRPSVRLETERRPNGTVIHNYGHGGSGYTLSWGCAADVLLQAQNAKRKAQNEG